MKISLVVKAYPTSRPGGMPFVCQDRARALVELGHEVHVLTAGLRNKQSIRDDRGVCVNHFACKSDEYSEEFAKECDAHSQWFRPDVLHSDSFDVHRPWWKDIARPTRVAITLHGFCWGSWFTKWNLWRIGAGDFPTMDEALARKFAKEAEMLGWADVVIGISRHEHYLLRDQLGLLHAKLVHNPICQSFFDHPVVPLPEKRRFMVASISGAATRGFDDAAKCAGMLGFDLVRANKVPRDQMWQQYDAASALVLPTCYSQGADLTVSEAISRGRPVIVTGTGSYLRESEPSGIWNGSTVLVPIGNHDALLRAMAGSLPDVNHGSMLLHRPVEHARKWLEAVS